jgi:ferredoxin/flavodoxin---NADP+ reductase
VARKENFRFFGYVEIGKDLSVEDLANHYHQIIYTTGAQTDRNLNIPGIDLENSHAATEFVAWYNGHPDYRDYEFDLSQERVAVIGVGNVAVDVCRILCRTPEELAKTDIADYALEALSQSNVKEVYMLGRRGPAQAAFTAPEIKELGEMDDADIIILPEEAELDPLSQAALEGADRGTTRQVEIIQSHAHRSPAPNHAACICAFWCRLELIGDENGRVAQMRLVKNELYQTEAGSLRPRATDEYETIPVGLVFRSIGYHGVPVPGVPFNEDWGVILNEDGRVMDDETGRRDGWPLHGRLDQAWSVRRHWHQQTGCGRNG